MQSIMLNERRILGVNPPVKDHHFNNLSINNILLDILHFNKAFESISSLLTMLLQVWLEQMATC